MFYNSQMDSFSCEDHEKTIHNKIKIYQCKICHEKKRGINNMPKIMNLKMQEKWR